MSTARNFPRSHRNAAAFLIGGALTLASALPASALTWTNVQCTVTGLECPQIGTPNAPCDCGLYKDAPGVASVSHKDTAFLFVSSNVVGGDETAEWKAPLAASLNGQATLEVRQAVNDSSEVTVILYDSTGGAGYANCLSVDPSVVAVLDTGDNGADSRFGITTVPIAAGKKVAGICLRISDNADTAVPVSKRSSAIVDYIAVSTAAGVKTYLEEFGLNF